MTDKNKLSIKKDRLAKAATILLIIGFIVMIIGFLPALSTIFIMFYYLILALVLILSLLTLLMSEDFMNLFSGGDAILQVIQTVIPYSPYVIGGTVLFFATSILLSALSKSRGKAVKIVFASIFMLVAIAGTVFLSTIINQN